MFSLKKGDEGYILQFYFTNLEADFSKAFILNCIIVTFILIGGVFILMFMVFIFLAEVI